MKLILQKDVKNLGKAGDQVSVKNGFARNFLIPKGYALILNKNRLKEWNHQKVIIEAKKRKASSERKSLIDKLSSVQLLFEKESQKDNKIFGSVTAHEISQALEEKHNISVDKKDIHFDELKTVGDHKISIHLSSKHKTEILLTIKGKLGKKKDEKTDEKHSPQEEIVKAASSDEISPQEEIVKAASSDEISPQAETEESTETTVVSTEKETQMSFVSKTADSTNTEDKNLKPKDVSDQSKNITAPAQPIENSTTSSKTEEVKAKSSTTSKEPNINEKTEEIKAKSSMTSKEPNIDERIASSQTSNDSDKSKIEDSKSSTTSASQEKSTTKKADKKSSGLLNKLFGSKK